MAPGNAWGPLTQPGKPGGQVAAWFGSGIRRLREEGDKVAGAAAFSHRRGYLIPEPEPGARPGTPVAVNPPGRQVSSGNSNQEEWHHGG
jgi:hypothetical protein